MAREGAIASDILKIHDFLNTVLVPPDSPDLQLSPFSTFLSNPHTSLVQTARD